MRQSLRRGLGFCRTPSPVCGAWSCAGQSRRRRGRRNAHAMLHARVRSLCAGDQRAALMCAARPCFYPRSTRIVFGLVRADPHPVQHNGCQRCQCTSCVAYSARCRSVYHGQFQPWGGRSVRRVEPWQCEETCTCAEQTCTVDDTALRTCRQQAAWPRRD